MVLSEKWAKRRKRTFEIIEIGAQDDFFSRLYDIFNMLSIVINLLVSRKHVHYH